MGRKVHIAGPFAEARGSGASGWRLGASSAARPCTWDARTTTWWHSVPVSGIAEFWAWWPAARPRIEAAIQAGSFTDGLIREIASRVEAMGSELDWEMGPGLEATHQFCVSAKGDPEARLVAESWLAAAPQRDPGWEFHAARQPRPHFDLRIDGQTLDPDDIRLAIEADEPSERVHITFFHPSFARGMDRDTRLTVAFLTLDGLLGEDGVERWVGAVEVADAQPAGAVELAALATTVEDLSARATGERFAILKGQLEVGRPLFVTVNRALKRVDHPFLVMHCEVHIHLRTPTPEGLTRREEARELDAMEDDLLGALGEQAAYLGRETGGGKRILHFFTTESGPGPAIVEAWIARYPRYRIEHRWQRDPAWRAARRWH